MSDYCCLYYSPRAKMSVMHMAPSVSETSLTCIDLEAGVESLTVNGSAGSELSSGELCCHCLLLQLGGRK